MRCTTRRHPCDRRLRQQFPPLKRRAQPNCRRALRKIKTSVYTSDVCMRLSCCPPTCDVPPAFRSTWTGCCCIIRFLDPTRSCGPPPPRAHAARARARRAFIYVKTSHMTASRRNCGMPRLVRASGEEHPGGQQSPAFEEAEATRTYAVWFSCTPAAVSIGIAHRKRADPAYTMCRVIKSGYTLPVRGWYAPAQYMLSGP